MLSSCVLRSALSTIQARNHRCRPAVPFYIIILCYLPVVLVPRLIRRYLVAFEKLYKYNFFQVDSLHHLFRKKKEKRKTYAYRMMSLPDKGIIL